LFQTVKACQEFFGFLLPSVHSDI